MAITPSKIFEVFEAQGRKRKLYTKNLDVGSRVYGENLVEENGVEYREWNPAKSKLAAAILKGAQNIGVRKGSIVLYLGSSTGTTVSHVSDMIGKEGIVFAVDVSATVMRDLLFLCERRENISPILESASHLNELAKRIYMADVLFQDIAQRDQVGIFLSNVEAFVKDGGYGLLAVKARSIDVAAKPKAIFSQVKAHLEKHVTIIDYRELEPFQKDHCMFIVKRKYNG
jgi:fibrillarin-like pre-rRNA processing protein